MKTVVTLFSGGGGSTLGAVAAGYTPVLSVEHSEKIAAVYADNLGAGHLRVADVCAVDYKPFAGVDMVTSSPPCTRATVAAPKAVENELDMKGGEATARAIRETRPRHFLMENVAGYRKFAAYKRITDELDAQGYWWEAKVLNAADFGVPQTRLRLIVRASRDGFLPGLPAPVAWRGWFGAVASELPNCEPSELAAWQKRRLPGLVGENLLPHPNADNDWFCVRNGDTPAFTITGSLNPVKALLVGDQSASAGGVGVQTRDKNEPAFTLCAKGNGRQGAPVLRVLLEDAVCLAFNSRCTANIQTFPAWYKLPAKKGDANTVVGNAFPPLMAQKLMEGLN